MSEYENLLISIKAVVTPEMNEDITSLIGRLEEEAKEYEMLYFETRYKLVESDRTVENQKRVLVDLDKVLKQYTKENEHFRGLLKLWI